MRSRVEVTVAGADDTTRAALTAVLRERLEEADGTTVFASAERVDPSVVVTPGAARDDVLARLWIDATAEARVTVYIVDGTWEHVLVRLVPRRENPEIVYEEIGHIVAGAVAALRSGERIGIGRDAAREELRASGALASEGPPAFAPPPAPEPSPSPSPAPAPSRPEARAGLYGAVLLVGPGGATFFAPGGSLSLVATRGRSHYGITATAEYWLPTRVGTSSSVRLEGGAVNALGGFARSLGRSDELGIHAGAGIAVMHASIDRPATTVELEQPRNTVVVDVRALARYTRDLGIARVFLGVGVDVPTRRTRYVVVTDAGPRVLFDAWSVRPLALLGVETP